MRSSQKLNTSLQKQITTFFAEVISETTNLKDATCFISGFFTDSEQNTFAKRLAIAYWLKKGRSYENIKTNLKVSSATIASVQEMMKSPGFQEALNRLEAEEWASDWSNKIKKFVHK